MSELVWLTILTTVFGLLTIAIGLIYKIMDRRIDILEKWRGTHDEWANKQVLEIAERFNSIPGLPELNSRLEKHTDPDKHPRQADIAEIKINVQLIANKVDAIATRRGTVDEINKKMDRLLNALAEKTRQGFDPDKTKS